MVAADAMILVFIINLYTTYHLLQHIFIQMMIRMIKISNVVYIFFSLNCCRPKSWPSLPTEAEFKKTKNTETEFGGNRKVALILSGREGNTVGSCLKNCTPPQPPMRSLGAYIR